MNSENGFEKYFISEPIKLSDGRNAQFIRRINSGKIDAVYAWRKGDKRAKHILRKEFDKELRATAKGLEQHRRWFGLKHYDQRNRYEVPPYFTQGVPDA